MASSPPASPLEQRQEHESNADREATEMGEYDEVLRRSSVDIDSYAPRPQAAPNETYLSFVRRSLVKLWQRQVSATVPHNTCRDHLGTLIFSFARPATQRSMTLDMFFS